MPRLESPGIPPDPQEPPLAPHDPVDPGPRDSGPCAPPVLGGAAAARS